MGRTAKADYVAIATKVLKSSGQASLKSKALYDAAIASGDLPESKWAYHNFLRGITLSSAFDTSKKGTVALMGAAAPAAAPAVAVKVGQITPDEDFDTKFEAVG